MNNFKPVIILEPWERRRPGLYEDIPVPVLQFPAVEEGGPGGQKEGGKDEEEKNEDGDDEEEMEGKRRDDEDMLHNLLL